MSNSFFLKKNHLYLKKLRKSEGKVFSSNLPQKKPIANPKKVIKEEAIKKKVVDVTEKKK
jgi:hypothetical protein